MREWICAVPRDLDGVSSSHCCLRCECARLRKRDHVLLPLLYTLRCWPHIDRRSIGISGIAAIFGMHEQHEPRCNDLAIGITRVCS
jgi:hypothetical protein